MTVYALDQMLVVAGASGVGKSTFMERLADGALEPSIAGHLPPDAPAWPLIGPRHHPEWLPQMRERARDGHRTAGAVLHMDTTGLHETPHEFAPAMQIVDLAQSVFVVEVRAPSHRVMTQFLDRECAWAFQNNREALPQVEALRRAFWDATGTPMDKLVISSAALGLGMQERFARRLANYRDPRWLADIETRWQRVLHRACRGRQVTVLTVDSAPGEPGGFRLLEGGLRSFPSPIDAGRATP